jgi:hypothetical protein
LASATLSPYQRNLINQLYEQTNDYEKVANQWLSATIPSNIPFGTQKKPSIFFEKVLDEIEAFFSGDEKYKDNRLAILKESGVVQSYIVDAISIALAPILGANAAFLAPVIAIVLLTIGKIGLNAWLAARKEKRKQNEDNDKQ